MRPQPIQKAPTNQQPQRPVGIINPTTKPTTQISQTTTTKQVAPMQQQQQSSLPQELIIQVRSPVGQNRITLTTEQTLNDLYQKISQIVDLPVDALILDIEGKLVTSQPQSKLKTVPGIEMGCMVTVKQNPKYKVQPSQKMQEEPQKQEIRTASGVIVTEEKLKKLEHQLQSQPKVQQHVLSQFCNHGPTSRCVSCMEDTKKVLEEKDKDQKPDKSQCNHGPSGKCLNCAVATKEELKTTKNVKLLCQHGPNGKCSHCLEDDQISNIKHLSFDQYLEDAKVKCRGQHQPEAKCNNCLAPTAVSYKLKRDCKNHAPWPQAMCNACLPPSVVLKRQAYRHVDYVEFLNIPEMSNFVQYWTSKGKTEQRVGFLYGYYAEDINYKGGVRAVVEAIYEPPQKGHMGSIEFVVDSFENQVNQIAGLLGLERIGWVFTTINHDTFLTSQELRQAAKFQEEFNVLHDSGCKVSKFLTVILRPKKDNPEEVVPEVYMISDQFQQLEKDGVFQESGRRKVLQVRNPETDQDIMPNFIYEGKSVTEFEPDFFIVNVAHGYNPSSNYNIIKMYDFPIENRTTQIKPQDVKQYLQKHKNKPSNVKFSNFHLLIFLCKFIDQDTVAIIAQMIGEEQEIPEEIQEVIKLYTNQ